MGGEEYTLSNNNVLSGNRATGNTVADITDAGTNTTSYCGIWKYDTGWVSCNDWTDQQLGTAVGGNVVHNLGINLSDMLVKVLISTDGTDTNSFECRDYMIYNTTGVKFLGITIYQVNTNQITIQTGTFGLAYITAAGVLDAIDDEAWYYKVKVYHLG